MSARSGRRERRLAALLLAPAGAVSALCFAAPVLWLGRMSLNESLPGGALREALTAASYVEFATDDFYLTIAANSIALSLQVTALVLVLTYPIALFLHRWQSPWKPIVVILTVSPLLVSAVVRTYGWMVILGDAGWLNAALRLIGAIAEPLALINNRTGVVIGLTEVLMPYMALALIAGFGKLDPLLEEAAATLGAPPWRRFWRVTLPLSLPGIGLGCLLTFVLAISAFITPKLLGGGRVFLLATEIFTQAIETLNWPLASAISVVVLAVFAGALVLYGRLAQRWAAL
ncbi:MAG: ABC transporter permease [Proteobacteria bacterium]|nr:ABC transporter permease [Pseudomonadota bacterium]